MEFYQSVLGGELAVSTFADFGQADDPAEADKVMHSLLEAPNGLVLMGADTPASMSYTAPPGVSISLSGDDDGALRRYWEAYRRAARWWNRWRWLRGGMPSGCASIATGSRGWSTSPARPPDCQIRPDPPHSGHVTEPPRRPRPEQARQINRCARPAPSRVLSPAPPHAEQTSKRGSTPVPSHPGQRSGGAGGDADRCPSS
jgi:hypothetical protein